MLMPAKNGLTYSMQSNISWLFLLSLTLLLSACQASEDHELVVDKEFPMKAHIYAEETLIVGKGLVVECPSPKGRYGVVFEDDGDTGYFYGLDMDRADNPIVDALHIYNAANITDKDIPSVVQVVWSGDGFKALLLINDYPHAVIDFADRHGYCRSAFPLPDPGWTKYDHTWDDATLDLFN
jgi:hypothetical protein